MPGEKVLLKKLVDGILSELYPQTKAEYVLTDTGKSVEETLAGKVDSVDGKGLSTEDFTPELLIKLTELKTCLTTDDIAETEAYKYVSPAEKEKINESGRIFLGSEPENMQESDILLEAIP